MQSQKITHFLPFQNKCEKLLSEHSTRKAFQSLIKNTRQSRCFYANSENLLAFFSDGMGGFNNVIKVHRDDMEVFKALDSDMADLAHRKFMHPVKVEAFSQSESGFTRDTPPWTNQLQPETVCGSGPPILPPQLGHVMLNKDTPLNCEPTLLPRPNHVMLNHLYAMSIKEQVMVLSMTSRHKSKYVTTILYRPVWINDQNLLSFHDKKYRRVVIFCCYYHLSRTLLLLYRDIVCWRQFTLCTIFDIVNYEPKNNEIMIFYWTRLVKAGLCLEPLKEWQA